MFSPNPSFFLYVLLLTVYSFKFSPFVYEYFAEEGDMVLDYLKGTETASKWMFDKNGYPISVVYDGGNGKCATEFVWE